MWQKKNVIGDEEKELEDLGDKEWNEGWNIDSMAVGVDKVKESAGHNG